VDVSNGKKQATYMQRSGKDITVWACKKGELWEGKGLLTSCMIRCHRGWQKAQFSSKTLLLREESHPLPTELNFPSPLGANLLLQYRGPCR